MARLRERFGGFLKKISGDYMRRGKFGGEMTKMVYLG